MTAPTGRLFKLGQVLTIACADAEAQQVFCTYGELLDVLGYLLDDVPLADDMAAAIEQCRGYVHRWHPDLAAVAAPALNAPDTTVLAWLAAQEAEHGPELLLRPIKDG
ncbi:MULTISPECIES: hypothetical protein [unclassified Mycobacterium]|uniref:hypothetical protein n=1 Tax=unclassified Mycobacterium TaxID=2642494 RepID=UPI0029C7B4FE|nr:MULTISPECIES: hypothetical protein [unclassified Mycobacterium]